MNSASPPTEPPARLIRPLRSIRIHAGFGDVLMAVAGLQALRELEADFLSPDVCVFTRTSSESLVQALLPGSDVRTLPNSAHAPHPRYVIVQHTSWTTLLRNWLSRDYYVNFPEERLLASYNYPRPAISRRTTNFLSRVGFGASVDWQRVTPSYYGIRMWAPLARKLGLTETDLVRGLYMAHHTLRARLMGHISALPSLTHAAPLVALFPSGGGFQYFPPAFTRDLITGAGLTNGDYACYFGPKDSTISSYQALGIECRITSTIDEMLQVVAKAAITVTADSFVSHVAQHIARQHVGLMSHDLPQHTVHPAATSRLVYRPQRCCPCYYFLRKENPRCTAGHEACGVFTMPEYLDESVRVLRGSCRAANSE